MILDTLTIPKIIHYCWFGDSKMSRMQKYCIDSWKLNLPDYKIVLWNESNSNFDCEFVRQAYNQKRWAYVSDYIRLKALDEIGGIYLDTDMLILRPLSEFLEDKCFFATENNTRIGSAIIGVIPGHSFINLFLEHFRGLKGIESDFLANTIALTEIFQSTYRVGDFEKNIKLSDISVYTSEYFYPIPYSELHDIHNYKKYLTSKSYGVHLWDGSWKGYNERVHLRRREYKKALFKIFRTLFFERKISFIFIKKVIVAFRDSYRTKDAFRRQNGN